MKIGIPKEGLGETRVAASPDVVKKFVGLGFSVTVEKNAGFYSSFSDDQVSSKVSELLTHDKINAEVTIIFQTVANLHIACPGHTGDWYFTGEYPTPGGNKVVNQAFINYFEGSNKRAY